MNPSYKKEKDSDYMVLEAPGKPDGSEYQIRMLMLNHIEGLLSCKMRRIDGITEYYYDITEKQPLTKVFLRERLGIKELRQLLECLRRAACEAERFLLGMEQFVLREDYIFRDQETGDFFFCCLPFYEGDLEQDFRELAEYLLKRLDHSQEEAVLWGYEIYSRASEEHFSIGKILESVHEWGGREKTREQRPPEAEEAEILEIEEEDPKENSGIKESHKSKEEKEAKRAPQRHPEKEQPPAAHPVKEEKKKKVKKREGSWIRKSKLWLFLELSAVFAIAVFGIWSQELNVIQAGGILFLGAGVILYFRTVAKGKRKKKEKDQEEELFQWDFSEEEGETVFLGTGLSETFPVLVSLDPQKGENIVLDKERLIVGKQKGQVDIFLDHSGISRFHAALEKREDGWYLVDLDSTNGTFVDGKKLKKEEQKLEEGMDVGFASWHYYYHGQQ